ncbi:4-deoxy-L-threo-5-hexosulose-uronate ketol-isomerase [Vibrio nigripulchritudo SFn27]|uniref:4-deoxy-L-threo-5-hexosulose-uronate ketol-isomerase n=1 Tax=Vibrio nigripulchritudo TaxID=28173 RepID=U4KI80_9VIBR|nr:5-dehydro-4-deoxy-D-glucuronate isomerase [Vibrio nigripulchritudo]CCN82482.1 4-deoxy-L-threo-5-hexosulose-uronate ketol-isomerase [Vibrio nigripulchritudo BLFn1]CCN91469.1 4-deoxy-L-threo-5-hexosulose-uronate ketol-isomerase [Vibrio nigripulchritudo SFn27]CCN97633.1 4-deoxy-L-threo-5-hexosulose-uronate ketol-isomerase [Vibrio nigripulchritudo ENn2]CCO38776.1 4-deoxy-L-threo-5-hexosulose-uronate ketol-isomerase [Vibrio nigripulchritudo SFn135]CCO55181.1 4-deoxy-L-threo-5-hexosulose-uronate 
MKSYYSTHSDDYRSYDTQTLRDRYLIESIFKLGHVQQYYCHDDRLIIAGICPDHSPLMLTEGKELGGLSFFERREAATINLGGEGRVKVGNETFSLGHKDALYIGQGPHIVTFESVDPDQPARFYLCSSPSHYSYSTTLIRRSEAKQIRLGDPKASNERIINQYIHPDVCKSSQLVMGLTELINTSNWNTMPCHTHARRMEAYFYFSELEDAQVFHFMGKPDETRHIVISNEQAVISPSWSIHSGVGTSPYSFIWAMAGENQEFDDMDFVAPQEMR